MTGLILFLREVMTHPSAMGALFPSSEKLAKQLIRPILGLQKGLIVELGAGTGAVTAVLVAQYTAQNMLVIERSTRLSNHLQARFPQLIVIEGDACHLSQITRPYPPIRAIVSSLPLRSLPKATVKAIGLEIDKSLSTGGLFIQYTYHLWGQPVSPSAYLKLIDSQTVWWNLPPARVDVFQHD